MRSFLISFLQLRSFSPLSYSLLTLLSLLSFSHSCSSLYFASFLVIFCGPPLPFYASSPFLSVLLPCILIRSPLLLLLLPISSPNTLCSFLVFQSLSVPLLDGLGLKLPWRLIQCALGKPEYHHSWAGQHVLLQASKYWLFFPVDVRDDWQGRRRKRQLLPLPLGRWGQANIVGALKNSFWL